MKSLVLLFAAAAASLYPQSNPPVTTGQYNAARTAANTEETILDVSNVNGTQFGKLFSWSVDGSIFAQPLYVPHLSIAGRNTDVVYVATMHNSIYAFDADNPGAAPLWSVTLGASVPASNNACPVSSYTGSELGILGTPVIDKSTNTLYAVSANPSGGGFVHTLHALDITTGVERSSTLIQASVAGSGYDNVGGRVTLNPTSNDVQRTALLLANGSVYAGFGNCGPDNDPWHGWVVGYSTANPQTQTALFNSTPNGGEGGIWQSGRGLAADSSGDVYLNTGNATPKNTTSGDSGSDAAESDYPMRFVKLSPGGQFLASFPPANYAALNANDLDFSSSGPLVIPGTNLLLTGGKDGVVYVFNPNNLATPVQSFRATGASDCVYSSDGCDQIHDLAFWNNTLYVWGTFDVLRAFSFNPSTRRFATTELSQGPVATSYHPAALAVSGNPAISGSGVVWATTPQLDSTHPDTLHAFEASNVANELWNSNQNADRDALPSASRFSEPTVAHGRVYVATQSKQLAVYGLLSEFSLATSTQSLTVHEGTSGSFMLDLTALPGFSGPVSFVMSGLPTGASASFSPRSLNSSGASTVTIHTALSTPPGTYYLILTGTGGGVTHTASVSLVVKTAIGKTNDDTPPQWSCCTSNTSGSSDVIGFSAWDPESGLKSIEAVQVVNATVSIPAFASGTNAVIDVTATETGWSSYVKFKLKDVAGNFSYIDLCDLDATRQTGQPIPFSVKNVFPGESFVTIQNGNSGIKNLRISVDRGNDTDKIEVAGLANGELRVVNIASLLPASGSTTVSVTPLGKPGGSATLVFAPGPAAPAR